VPTFAPTGQSGSSNFDPGELSKFQSLASRWWDPESEFKPLHAINPLRLGWIDALAPLTARRIVDVGCGGGILAESMARAGAVVTGIDLADRPLKVAELHRLESGVSVDYRRIAAEDLAQAEPEAFDTVTCMEMLEHVPNPASTIRACAELAKPGGWLFFSTINRNPKAFLFAIIGAEYVLRLLPRGTHEYDKFIKPSELVGSARSVGLELVEMKGLTYNPLTQVYALHPNDISVNYLVAMRKPAP